MGFVPIKLDKIMQARTYTMFVMKGEDKRFAIYTTPAVGHTLQGVLAKQKPTRPSTVHMMSSILSALRVDPVQVVIWDVHETVYTAHIFIKQERDSDTQMLEVDARPSDCLALALMHDVPILCRQEVLDKVICIED